MLTYSQAACLGWLIHGSWAIHDYRNQSALLFWTALCLLAATGITCQSGPPQSCHFKCNQYLLPNQTPLNHPPPPHSVAECFDQYLTLGQKRKKIAPAVATTRCDVELNASQFTRDNNTLCRSGMKSPWQSTLQTRFGCKFCTLYLWGKKTNSLFKGCNAVVYSKHF